MKALRRGKKSQNFEHHTFALLSSKDELCVGGTVQDNQFLGLRSFIEMCSQAGKPWSVTARVVARHDIELANSELFRWPPGCGPQQDQAIDLAWLCDSSSGGGTAPKLPPIAKTLLVPLSRR